VTPAKSVIAIVAEALFVLSATLVAVTVTLPVVFGAVRLAVVLLWLLNDPLDVLQLTPATPTSFSTVAENVIVCPVTAPPRAGVSATLTGGGGGGVDELQAIPKR
jgi:hypothetical protein